MSAPFQPDPNADAYTASIDQLLGGLAAHRMREASEAFERGVAGVSRALLETIVPPQPDRPETQVWIRPHGEDDWQHLADSPMVSFDPGVPDNCAMVMWPRHHGKRALTGEITFEGPLSETARLWLEPLFADLLVRRDRTVHRLAHELGLDIRAARHQFDLVQHILESAGIGDGYGRLTIRQPVRPPVQAPRRWP